MTKRFLAVTLLLMLLVWLVWRMGSWEPGRGSYLFLFVWENNTAALAGQPLGGSPWPEITPDPPSGSLTVPAGTAVPDGKRPVLVLQRIDSLDTHLASRLFAAERLPEIIEINRPVQWEAEVFGPDGRFKGKGKAVRNEERLLAGNIKLVGIDPDGTVRLTYGERDLELRPGESWGELRISRPDGQITVRADQWEKEAQEALEKRWVMTRLTVQNLGWWKRERIKVR
ncbi:MAG: hypothetical protein M1299_03150 [Firmicutes bacterium]|nr:hypothetical protein [Bacillota bacterium]MCL5038814.1 hypothetical protein [Bacillota bacterium]